MQWKEKTFVCAQHLQLSCCNHRTPTVLTGASVPFPVALQGYKFANQEAKIVLVRLFQTFTFTLTPGMPKIPRTATGLTTGPADGVPVTVHSRN